MQGRESIDFGAFDDVWEPLTPKERKEADALLRRYVEIVIGIAERHARQTRTAEPTGALTSKNPLTDEKGSRMLTLS